MSKPNEPAFLGEKESIECWLAELPTVRLRRCLSALGLWKMVTPYQAKVISARIDAMLEEGGEG